MDIIPTIQHLHGRIRSITGTDPAADTEISETVPDRRRWRILTIYLILVTDANVADRIPNLIIDNGTTSLYILPSDTAHTASLTRHYNYSTQPVPQFLSDIIFHLPLPHLILPAGYRIRTTTTNKQVGDNYSAPQLLVEEWIDP